MPIYVAEIYNRKGEWLDELSALGEVDIREEVRIWIAYSPYTEEEISVEYWEETV